jgi:hypothetical protein
MHDAMRRRILRRLETLPETQLYQVLDYIEFLESRYNRGVPEETTPLQKLAERLEDGLRKGNVNPGERPGGLPAHLHRGPGALVGVGPGKQLLEDLQTPPAGGGIPPPPAGARPPHPAVGHPPLPDRPGTTGTEAPRRGFRGSG